MNERFRHRRARFAPAAVLALWLSACASPPVAVDCTFDRTVDFSAIRTWAWVPEEQPEIPDPRVVDSLVDARMRRVIADELASRGLRRAEDATPDVWVRYRLWVMPRDDFNPLLPGDSTREPLRETRRGSPMDDVGLRIEMCDGRERAREIWRAEGRVLLALQATEDERARRTVAAVRRLLSHYPPG